MVQTDLKSDNFCGYNTSAAPFYWILDGVQNNVQFNAGEVGVATGIGLHTPAEVIDVSSMIVGGGRDSYLSKCNPPAPPLPSTYGNATDASIRDDGPKLQTQGFSDRANDVQVAQTAQFHEENTEHFNNIDYENKKNEYGNIVDKADGTRATLTDKSQFLLPQVSTQRGAAKDYSSVYWQAGFSGNAGNLFTNPQDLTYVIERMWLERGGVDQNQIIKQSQESWTKNTRKDGPKGPKNLQGKYQEPTCEKIRQPYNIKYPFGLPTDPVTGEELRERSSKHFNAIDVASLGISSPILEQDPRIPFNYHAIYSNGGCNEVSFLDNNKMCSDTNNDLTGINSYNFSHDMPPRGTFPLNSSNDMIPNGLYPENPGEVY